MLQRKENRHSKAECFSFRMINLLSFYDAYRHTCPEIQFFILKNVPSYHTLSKVASDTITLDISRVYFEIRIEDPLGFHSKWFFQIYVDT